MNHNPIIVALDVPSSEAAVSLATKLNGKVGLFKIGLQLFTAEGPKVIEAVKKVAPDVGIFLDLKLHDIPNTMRGAIQSAKNLGVEMMTIHSGSGFTHMQACVEEAGDDIKILAVTVLTSMDVLDCSSAGHTRNPTELVQLRVAAAAEARCFGIVCSGQELDAGLPKKLWKVVPGIRPSGSAVGDQKRVVTPRQARDDGASVLVIGRPISKADDPLAAAKAIEETL